jgi:transcriptional regulator with XRE-family HTH domain
MTTSRVSTTRKYPLANNRHPAPATRVEPRRIKAPAISIQPDMTHAWTAEGLFALLNECLRRYRLERGWTLQDVADGLDALAPSELGKPHLGVTAAMVGDWERGKHRPRPPYLRLLCVLYDASAAELGLYDQPRAWLSNAEGMRVGLPADAQPWRLARALEAASIGSAGVTALEQAVGEFARSYPSTSPTVLAEPVFKHFRDVVRLLEGPLPVALRRRLAVSAGHLAGLAGNLSFDLREAAKALAYFEVAIQAADDTDAPDLAAWALATQSIVPTYTGDPATALRLLQEAQDRAAGHVSPTRRAWLAAMAARAHAGLGDARSSLVALGQAEAAIERAEPSRTAARSVLTSSTCPAWPASAAPATFYSASPKPHGGLGRGAHLAQPNPTSRDGPSPGSTSLRPTPMPATSKRPAPPSPRP